MQPVRDGPSLTSLDSLFDAMRHGLTDGPLPVEYVLLAAVLLIGIAIVGGARFLTRRSTHRAQEIDYLTATIDLLGLSEQDRRDLLTAAKRCDCRHPISLLLSPSNYARALDAAVGDEALRARLEAIGNALFDGNRRNPPAP